MSRSPGQPRWKFWVLVTLSFAETNSAIGPPIPLLGSYPRRQAPTLSLALCFPSLLRPGYKNPPSREFLPLSPSSNSIDFHTTFPNCFAFFIDLQFLELIIFRTDYHFTTFCIRIYFPHLHSFHFPHSVSIWFPITQNTQRDIGVSSWEIPHPPRALSPGGCSRQPALHHYKCLKCSFSHS